MVALGLSGTEAQSRLIYQAFICEAGARYCERAVREHQGERVGKSARGGEQEKVNNARFGGKQDKSFEMAAIQATSWYYNSYGFADSPQLIEFKVVLISLLSDCHEH